MKNKLLLMALLTFACGFALSVGAETRVAEPLKKEVVALKTGDTAPDISIPAEKADDPAIKLSSFQGKKSVLIAFYPKVFTPGCTKQMCGYRDDFATLEKEGLEIIAISLDKQTESDRFKAEHKLPFRVVGDPEGIIVDAFGVPRIDKGDFAIAQRSVFLVDKTGVLKYVDLEYKVDEDKAPLYDAITEAAKETK